MHHAPECKTRILGLWFSSLLGTVCVMEIDGQPIPALIETIRLQFV